MDAVSRLQSIRCSTVRRRREGVPNCEFAQLSSPQFTSEL
ncbi:hypothetical protein ACP70R_041353 [Stipagrostis hirtigluma subsp. patula]